MPLHGICINPNQPLNLACPWNRGLVSMWLNLPQGVWGGGRTWRDLNRASLNDGTLTNMAFPATSTSGWGGTTRPGGWGEVRFDGVNDYVTATGTAFGAGDFTISAWVKPTNFSFNYAVYDTAPISGAGNRVNGFVLFIEQTTGMPKAFSNNVFLTSGTIALTAGAWSHVAWVRSGTTLTYYVNGKAAGTATLATSITETGAQIGVFANVPTGTGSPYLNWVGAIDDVRSRNVAASATEVAALYADSQTGYRRTLNWVRPRAYAGQAAGGLLRPNSLEGLSNFYPSLSM